MDVIDSLNTNMWESAQAEDYPEFADYTIIRNRKVDAGVHEIACKQLTNEGDIPHIMAKLEGTANKMNPLNGVRNCQLIVHDKTITGINITGDCAVRKDIAK